MKTLDKLSRRMQRTIGLVIMFSAAR